MSAFDLLTLGEVEDIQNVCLDGKPFTEADPLKLAGAVMWITKRKNGDPELEWDDFRFRTTMGEIKAFSETEMSDADPTQPPGNQTP